MPVLLPLASSGTPDLGTMTQRIRDEILRDTDVETNYIKKAIASAIRTYRYHRFWFNEGTFTLSTVDGTQDYSAVSSGSAGYPRDLISVDRLTLVHNTSLIKLPKVGIQEFRDLDSGDNTEGRPSCWTFHHESLMLYPTPDAVYTIRGDYVKELTGLDGDDDRLGLSAVYVDDAWSFRDVDGNLITDSYTSAWFDEAEEMVRAKAKALVYSEVLRDTKAAAEQEAIAASHYANLKHATDGFEMPERIVPWD